MWRLPRRSRLETPNGIERLEQWRGGSSYHLRMTSAPYRSLPQDEHEMTSTDSYGLHVTLLT